MPKSSHLTITLCLLVSNSSSNIASFLWVRHNTKRLHETLYFVLPCFCKSKHSTLLALFYRQVKWGTGTLSNVPNYYTCLHSPMTQRYFVYLSVHFPNSQSLQKKNVPDYNKSSGNNNFLPASEGWGGVMRE